MTHVNADVVIVGAGPAGIAAACEAGQTREVTIIDDNPAPGGQIWRGGAKAGSAWLARLSECIAKCLYSARAVGVGEEPKTLLVESGGRIKELRYLDLILATGARELFLPFPGWTLPNVMGPGGLQALVKSGLDVRGKRVVVAGSGPLLLAVAASLLQHGASVPCIVEQAPFTALSRFAKRLFAFPRKMVEGARLQLALLGTRYLVGTWIASAEGNGRVESVTLRSNHGTWQERCDYLAIAYGLTSNLELPVLLGCNVADGTVVVNEGQQTSVEHVYCAGEPTGVGGVDLSLIEGRIAGAICAGDNRLAASLVPDRRRWRRFAEALNEAFRARPEILALARAETIVCRCEDVTLGRLRQYTNWRASKLYTRCGMGPCQGRICGPAVRHLLGWNLESVRPPIFPVSVGALAGTETESL